MLVADACLPFSLAKWAAHRASMVVDERIKVDRRPPASIELGTSCARGGGESKCGSRASLADSPPTTLREVRCRKNPIKIYSSIVTAGHMSFVDEKIAIHERAAHFRDYFAPRFLLELQPSAYAKVRARPVRITPALSGCQSRKRSATRHGSYLSPTYADAKRPHDRRPISDTLSCCSSPRPMHAAIVRFIKL